MPRACSQKQLNYSQKRIYLEFSIHQIDFDTRYCLHSLCHHQDYLNYPDSSLTFHLMKVKVY